MKNDKSKFALALIAVIGLCGLAACSNTFQGAGQDIQNAGEAVEDAAK